MGRPVCLAAGEGGVDQVALTVYNSYDCAKDPRHTFTPTELERMKRADAQIDAEFDREMSGAPEPVKKKRVRKPLTPEQRERARLTEKAYREIHRYEINQRRIERRQTDPEFNSRERAYHRDYWRNHYSKASKNTDAAQATN